MTNKERTKADYDDIYKRIMDEQKPAPANAVTATALLNIMFSLASIADSLETIAARKD